MASESLKLKGDTGGQFLLMPNIGSITIVAPWSPDHGRSLGTMLHVLGHGGGLGVLSTKNGKRGPSSSTPPVSSFSLEMTSS